MADFVETSINLPFGTINFPVPASTVDAINTNPFPILLVVTTAGTLTVIKYGVPGSTVTAVGTALPQQIVIPAGAAINLTYSVAPAWTAFDMQ